MNLTSALQTLTLISLLANAGGCAWRMAEPPPLYSDPSIDPFGWISNEPAGGDAEVIIVSDRKSIAGPNGQYVLLAEGGSALSASIARVRFGDAGDGFEEVSNESIRGRERPSMEFVDLAIIGRLAPAFPSSESDIYQPIYKASQQVLAEEIDRRLAESGSDELLLFVHGSMTKVGDNALIAAQLWHFGGRRGAVVSYEWPSVPSILDYTVDKQNAQRTTRNFRLLLEFLSRRTRAGRIDIVVHSAGSPIVAQALHQLALTHRNREPEQIRAESKIGTVVFAAGDIDQVEFATYMLDGMHEVAQEMQIYSSSRDKALNISAWLFGQRRLGSTSLVNGPRGMEAYVRRLGSKVFLVDVVDAQLRHGDFLGHSYFYNDPWVLSDLILLLRTGLPPAQRGLELRDQGVWHFPSDYEARARELGPAVLGVKRRPPEAAPVGGEPPRVEQAFPAPAEPVAN